MPSALVLATDSNLADLKAHHMVALEASGYWSPLDMLRHEAEFFRALRDLQSRPRQLDFPADWLEDHIAEFVEQKKSKLDAAELNEQFHTVFHALEENATLSVVIGPPGAAKSTIASLWAHVARARYPDMPIFLVTQERTALQRLQERINIGDAIAATIDIALDDTSLWPENAAIIIDEASLFDTAIMARLLQRAAQANAAKVILIGDEKQLMSHTPGEPFRWLCQQPDTSAIALTHPYRQKNSELHLAVQALYQGDKAAAALHLNFQFLHPAKLSGHVKKLTHDTTPDRTFIIVHGPLYLQERLRIACPGFRILSLAAAQGLAVDHVVLVLAQETNLAELLVGCSRQRFQLDIVIDADIYHDKEDFMARLGAYPKNLMALDVIDPETLLQIIDQA